MDVVVTKETLQRGTTGISTYLQFFFLDTISAHQNAEYGTRVTTTIARRDNAASTTPLFGKHTSVSRAAISCCSPNRDKGSDRNLAYAAIRLLDRVAPNGQKRNTSGGRTAIDFQRLIAYPKLWKNNLGTDIPHYAQIVLGRNGCDAERCRAPRTPHPRLGASAKRADGASVRM